MSVIDEKTIAGLLERIGVLKKELSNLESAILAIKLEPETASPDSGSLRSAPYPGECSPEPDLTVSESPAAAPAESPEPVAQPVEEPIDIAPVDDTPIDISISDIEDLPEELENRGSTPLTNRGSTPLTNRGSTPLTNHGSTPLSDRSLSGAGGPAPTTSELGQRIEEPKKSILDTAKADTAVMDVMAEKQAWRTDRPGMPVKNIISAISLNDRVYLINTLFGEDPMLFQETIGKFNAMGSLSEALAYIADNHSDWDMSSEPVYRLMMAVRRKLA